MAPSSEHAGPRVVLIVDDDEGVRDALAELLAAPGRELLLARDGEEALALAHRAGRPCLVLLDWVMPRADGAAFLAGRDASGALAHVPVFVTSGTHRPEGDPRVQGVLGKPVDLDELRRAVAAACERHCDRAATCPYAPPAARGTGVSAGPG